eukprot:m.3954 g.3954  ORF g.3954 m.3954 type:complete len:62 (+) comp2150_c0_seq1:530-715(+)
MQFQLFNGIIIIDTHLYSSHTKKQCKNSVASFVLFYIIFIFPTSSKKRKSRRDNKGERGEG